MPCLHLLPAPYSHPRCALSLFGGRPSPGTCAICPQHTAEAPPLAPPPSLADLLTPAQRLRLAARRALCAPCPHNNALTLLTVRCAALHPTAQPPEDGSGGGGDSGVGGNSGGGGGDCSCSALNLLNADCPLAKW